MLNMCEGLLAGGTTSGRVGLWKYCPAPGITEPEDQWQSQTPSSIVGPVLEVEVCEWLFVKPDWVWHSLLWHCLLSVHLKLGKIFWGQFQHCQLQHCKYLGKESELPTYKIFTLFFTWDIFQYILMHLHLLKNFVPTRQSRVTSHQIFGKGIASNKVIEMANYWEKHWPQ